MDNSGSEMHQLVTCGPQEALQAAFPGSPHAAPSSTQEDDDEEVLVSESDMRKWKAEQANQALWAFGGRVRQVQQDWKRLQEQIRAAGPHKRQRTAAGAATQPPQAHPCGPLLLLNQFYWEQGLGASINSIQGDNIFGINMYGSYSSICQILMPNSASPTAAAAGNNHAAAAAAPCNSSSNTPMCPEGASVGADSNDAARGLTLDTANLTLLKQQQQQQGLMPRVGVDGASHSSSCPASPAVEHKQQQKYSGSSSSSRQNSSCLDAGTPLPTAAAEAATDTTSQQQQQRSLYDFDEIEAVCRQQNLTHLPASRRFVRALRFMRAAKQQQLQQAADVAAQQGASVAVQPPTAVGLVTVV